MSEFAVDIPIYPFGQQGPYHSMESKTIPGLDGKSLGSYDITLPDQIKRNATPEIVTPWLKAIREIGLPEMLKRMKAAADIFLNNVIEVGGVKFGPKEYCQLQSLATGMPEIMCLENMRKIHRSMVNVEQTMRGHLKSWRSDISLEDLFMGVEGPGFGRQALILGGIYPSNTSAVYQLLAPGMALGPVLIKPGSGDLFTAVRLRQACLAEGLPVEAFGIFPGDGETLADCIAEVSQRRLVFGDADTVSKYHGNPEVEIHGPGCSKIIIGPDMVEGWSQHLDTMVASIEAGSGRGCISCSAIYARKDIAEKLALVLAERLGPSAVLPMNDPAAKLAAFTSPNAAKGKLEIMKEFVEYGKGRFVTPLDDRVFATDTYSVLRPTVAYLPQVPPPGALSASKFEIPAPAVLIVNSDGADLAKVIGNTLVCTVISNDTGFVNRLADEAKISRFNRLLPDGQSIATTQLFVEGEEPRPLEGDGMPRFLYEKDRGKAAPTY